MLLHIMASMVSGRQKQFYFCKLDYLTGEVRFSSLYREQERIGISINEHQNSKYFSGGLVIQSTSGSSIKNFLVLDLDAAYLPKSNKDNFLVIPDQSEVRSTKKLDLTASFFKEENSTLVYSATTMKAIPPAKT